MIVALNALLLVLPWHTNIPTGEDLPPHTAPVQYIAVGFVMLFVLEVGVELSLLYIYIIVLVFFRFSVGA